MLCSARHSDKTDETFERLEINLLEKLENNLIIVVDIWTSKPMTLDELNQADLRKS